MLPSLLMPRYSFLLKWPIFTELFLLRSVPKRKLLGIVVPVLLQARFHSCNQQHENADKIEITVTGFQFDCNANFKLTCSASSTVYRQSSPSIKSTLCVYVLLLKSLLECSLLSYLLNSDKKNQH